MAKGMQFGGQVVLTTLGHIPKWLTQTSIRHLEIKIAAVKDKRYKATAPKPLQVDKLQCLGHTLVEICEA